MLRTLQHLGTFLKHWVSWQRRSKPGRSSRRGALEVTRSALVLFLVVLAPALRGQSDDSNAGTSGSRLGGSSRGAEGAPGYPGSAGGMSMADFQSLIMLIQSTIDPDSWIDTGTGTSSIMQYPNGVFVDPSGQVQRRLQTDATLQSATLGSGAPRQPWRTTSPQRTISLKALDRALQRMQQQGVAPSAEMRQLAGLSRIDVIQLDVANEDVLLSGPATDTALGFRLEDLAVVTAAINPHTDPLGCSIDPTHAGLLAAQDFLQQPGALDRLARAPKAFVTQLQSKVGAHHVSVFGLHANSGTALAMIDADEHMKRVGFGLERTPVGIKSYFEQMEQLKAPQAQSLVRWWFAYADEPIRVNPQRNIFKLPEQCARVMSEQQFVTQQGRGASGQQDAAADAFASEMSAQMSALRESHPSYARLCSVFEAALGLQLALDATGQPSFAAWFPTLHAAGQPEQAVEQPEPKTVSGLTTWHRMRNGTVVAVVSGGVTLSLREAAAATKWEESTLLSGSVVPTAPAIPSAAHEHWWWN